MLLVTVKEEQGNAVFGVHFAFNQMDITNNTSILKVRIAKLTKTDLACSVTVRIPA